MLLRENWYSELSLYEDDYRIRNKGWLIGRKRFYHCRFSPLRIECKYAHGEYITTILPKPKITDVDEKLIQRFAIILNVLTSGQDTNSEKFEKYSRETMQRYSSFV